MPRALHPPWSSTSVNLCRALGPTSLCVGFLSTVQWVYINQPDFIGMVRATSVVQASGYAWIYPPAFIGLFQINFPSTLHFPIMCLKQAFQPKTPHHFLEYYPEEDSDLSCIVCKINKSHVQIPTTKLWGKTMEIVGRASTSSNQKGSSSCSCGLEISVSRCKPASPRLFICTPAHVWGS